MIDRQDGNGTLPWSWRSDPWVFKKLRTLLEHAEHEGYCISASQVFVDGTLNRRLIITFYRPGWFKEAKTPLFTVILVKPVEQPTNYVGWVFRGTRNRHARGWATMEIDNRTEHIDSMAEMMKVLTEYKGFPWMGK